MNRYTIVPSSLFVEDDAYDLLSELVTLSSNDRVKHMELPECGAVLVYCNDVPPIATMLGILPSIEDYNKVIFEMGDGEMSLVIAAGEKLLLANTYPVPDFTTAEYFIFTALKEFQINAEMTTIYHHCHLEYEQKEHLFKFFLGVEEI